MKHILCITSGLTGILNASFELTSRLKAAGYKVTYACPKDVGNKVNAQQINYIQLAPVSTYLAPEIPAFNGSLRKLKRMRFKLINRKQRKQLALEALRMDEFSQTLEQLSPDLLIIDVELHEHIMTAFSMKQPMILLSQWFSLSNQAGLPPLLDSTIPGKGWKGHSLGLKLRWWSIRRNRWWIFTKKRILSVGTNRRSILLAYAKKVKFPLSYIKENYWPGPFTYSTLPMISMTAAELEFPHKKRENLFYIGPMVYENRVEHIENKQEKRSIDDALRFQKEKNAALLYCTVSTLSKGDINFIRKLIKAVEQRKDWVLIVSLGGLERKNIPENLSDNIFVFSYTPQLKVLKHTDCSVNHGGIHTINECIHFKVPMLIYSGKTSDQNGCAARVAYHGLGIMADKEKDSPADIQKNITEILNNKAYRQKMEKMHQHYIQYQKEQRFEKKINAFLKKN